MGKVRAAQPTMAKANPKITIIQPTSVITKAVSPKAVRWARQASANREAPKAITKSPPAMTPRAARFSDSQEAP